MTIAKTPLTLVFDLDGTLVDTAPDLTNALNHVLIHLGRATVDVEDVRTMVGHGARALIRAGTKATGAMIEKDQEIEPLYALFLDYYSANICRKSQVFPGVINALTHFSKMGAKMSICTNKPVKMSQQLVTELRLQHFFAANLGGDSLNVKKPDPRHILEAIKRSGGLSKTAIMIGDSRTDFDTARSADIPIILVDFGYSDVAVHSLDPDAVISHFDELKDAVAQISNV